MPRYVIAVVLTSGKSFEKNVNAVNEKIALRKVWDELTSPVQDNVESLEVVDELKEYA